MNRGARQGDPLSPLFSLSLEILIDYIRQDENIQEIKINSKETKLTLFADDLTCFVKNKISYFCLFASLKIFSYYSGLRVNDEKTELFTIGSQRLVREEFQHKVCTSIKILGIYFDYHTLRRKNLNFDSIFKCIQ